MGKNKKNAVLHKTSVFVQKEIPGCLACFSMRKSWLMELYNALNQTQITMMQMN